MSSVIFVLLILQLVLILAWGLSKNDRAIQYPTMLALGFIGYLMPQFVSLFGHQNVDVSGFTKTEIMATLCFAAVFIGYTQTKTQIKAFSSWSFSRSKLVTYAIICLLFGGIFFLKISQLSAEVTVATGGQWSGVITIFVFLSQFLTVGLIISLTLFLKRPSLPTLIMSLSGMLFYFVKIFFYGRRAAMLELFLIITMAVFYNKKWSPPRLFIFSGALLGALVVNSIGDYRSTVLEGDQTTWTGAGISDILKIPFVENLVSSFNGAAPDVSNAVYKISKADLGNDFDYGLSFYNSLILRFVPAQILGTSFKESLKADIASDRAVDRFRFTGTTNTGFADAFGSFWYFGCFIFFFIGVISKKLFLAASSGNYSAQIISILVSYPALLAITHSTNEFFLKFIELIVLLLPGLYFAKRIARF